MQIAKIEVNHDPFVMVCTNNNWEKNRLAFFNKTGINIPAKEDMGTLKDETLWRFFLDTMTMNTYWDTGEVWEFTFGVGWGTDYGSSPAKFRSFVDNDDQRFLPGYWGHDFLFQSKFFGLTERGLSLANHFLIEAFRYGGASVKEMAFIRLACKSKEMERTYFKREYRDKTIKANLEVRQVE